MEDKENLAFLDKGISCEHLKDVFQIHWEVSCAMYKRFFFPEIRHNLFPSPLVLARIYKGEAQLSFD